MLNFAFDGITSLSVKPIRLITGLGFFISLASFIGIIWVLLYKAAGRHGIRLGQHAVRHFLLWVACSFLCLGVIGEYIGKIYNETKQRPRFIISETTFDSKEK